MVVRLPPWLTMNYGLNKLHMKVEKGYCVSGTCELPAGYRLAYVTPNAQVEHVMSDTAVSRILQPSYSLASGVISIVQIFSACSALYQSKGYQIDAYGYAAFGFTVTPYLVMSFLNLLANCFTPTFPSLYLVHTEIMDEAISRGGQFTDIVGKLESEPLLVEDLTVFSASIEQAPQGMDMKGYTCRIANHIFEHGSTEPISNDKTAEQEEQEGKPTTNDHIIPLPSPLENAPSLPGKDVSQKQAITIGQDHNPNETQPPPEPDDDSSPVLLIPSCYKFKLAYSNTSSTSILWKKRHYGLRGWLMGAANWGVAALPFIPLGVMSKFRTGTSSTLAQRIWLMAWYVVGIVSVSNPYFTDHIVDVTYRNSRALIKDHEMSGLQRFRILFSRAFIAVGMLVFYVTPAMGGFVVVGQMLVAYGTCTSL